MNQFSFFENNADDYLHHVSDWSDPYPSVVVKEHEGFLVARDDLFEYGSKTRFADHLIQSRTETEYVYGGSPAQGYAQISLAFLCRKYGKKCIIYSPERSLENLSPQQHKAISLGAEMRWIKTYGGMSPCIKAASSYCDDNKKERFHLPLGLDHPVVLGGIVKVARSLNVNPKRVFTVAGSGTLSRGMQLAFPDAQVYAIQVGRTMSPEEYGRATVLKSPYDFKQNIKSSEMPPYPAIANYDAKVWKFAKEFGESGDLIWNVAAPL